MKLIWVWSDNVYVGLINFIAFNLQVFLLVTAGARAAPPIINISPAALNQESPAPPTDSPLKMEASNETTTPSTSTTSPPT